MNDFAELEEQLKKLRPAKVSDELFLLVGEELVDLATGRVRPNGGLSELILSASL
jgi:hypothetical protein